MPSEYSSGQSYLWRMEVQEKISKAVFGYLRLIPNHILHKFVLRRNGFRLGMARSRTTERGLIVFVVFSFKGVSVNINIFLLFNEQPFMIFFIFVTTCVLWISWIHI